MRNLVRYNFKRFFFRWETFLALGVNLLLGVLSGGLGLQLLEVENYVPFQQYFFAAFCFIGLFMTMATIISTEMSNYTNGIIRNQVISGYTKAQIFAGKYISVLLISLLEGLCMMIPTALIGSGFLFDEASEYALPLVVSLTLVYQVVACTALTFCLIIGKTTPSTIVCTGTMVLLLLLSIFTVKRLDAPENKYKPHPVERDQIVGYYNEYYIDSPARDAVEQLNRFNPMEPVYEFAVWYLPSLNNDYYIEPYYWENSRVYRAEHMNDIPEFQRHTDRLNCFPLHQIAVIFVISACGVLVFRRRNIT